MKKFATTLALLLTLGLGSAKADDKKKLSPKDFDLINRVEKVEGDVADLKGKIDRLEKKLAELIAKKESPRAEPGAQPAKPEGEGWQWDGKNWWRYAPSQQPFQAQPFILPAGGNCPNGRCPLPGR